MYAILKLLDAGTDAAVRIAPDEPRPTMTSWKIPNKEINLGAGGPVWETSVGQRLAG
jgi:hypothetical protein